MIFFHQFYTLGRDNKEKFSSLRVLMLEESFLFAHTQVTFGWLVACLFVCLFVCLVGWLVGWLVVWLVVVFRCFSDGGRRSESLIFVMQSEHFF